MLDATFTPDAQEPGLQASALTRTSARTLTEQLAERFASRIRDRLLPPGARLPSVRQCALQHDLNPSTVVAAYDQLIAQGLIERAATGGFLSGSVCPRPARGRAALHRPICHG